MIYHIHVDNHTSFIQEQLSELYKQGLRNILSYKSPDAEAIKYFGSAGWDGITYLITDKRQQFMTGLLHYVEEYFHKNSLQYEIVDQRGKPGPNANFEFLGELRDYQEEDAKQAVEAGRAILQEPTGAGKTVILAGIIAKMNVRPVGVLVFTQDVLYQTKEFIKQFLGVEAGQIGDGVWDPQDITVCTVQSFFVGGRGEKKPKKMIDEQYHEKIQKSTEFLEQLQAVFVDEAHHVPTKTVKGLLRLCKKAYYRFGLSATPWRDDNADKEIEGITGGKIVARNASDLIARGWLLPPKIYLVPIKRFAATNEKQRVEMTWRDFAKFADKKNYQWRFSRWVDRNEYRNEIIVKLIQMASETYKPVLVLVRHILHGDTLEKLVRENTNLSVAFINSKNVPAKERKARLEQVRNNELDVLIATSLADEGLDLPALNSVIVASGGKSSTKIFQRVGRALRPNGAVEDALIIDFKDFTKHLKSHSEARHRLYKTEPLWEIKELTDAEVQKILSK